MKRLARLAAVLLCSAPALGEVRTLDVPATATWKHAGSGVSAPSAIAGLKRSEVRDRGQTESDVSATYLDADRKTELTLYIFRPGVADLAVWFDRAQGAMETRPQYGIDKEDRPSATVFALPRAKQAGAMRVSHATPRSTGGVRSTMLLVAPAGEWLVKMRLSSKVLEVSDLERIADAAVIALKWPLSSRRSDAVSEVATCQSAFVFGAAAPIKPGEDNQQIATVISSLLIAPAVTEKNRKQKPVYCRDPRPLSNATMYRPDESLAEYVVAILDAGEAVIVRPAKFPALPASIEVQRVLADKTEVYPRWDGLPTPEQAWHSIQHSAPLGTGSRGGRKRTIQINTPDAKAPNNEAPRTLKGIGI